MTMGYTWNPLFVLSVVKFNIKWPHQGVPHVTPEVLRYNMATTNWKVVRNEYETLGTSIKELASSHHTTEALVRTAIEDGGWKKYDVEEMSSGTEDLSARLAAMDVRHQSELVPRFIALQTKMLEKCDTLLDGVSNLEDAAQLKTVSEVIEKHRPAIMGDSSSKGEDNNITVRILSKVGDGADVAVNAVEITAKAGESNGLGQGVPCGTPIN